MWLEARMSRMVVEYWEALPYEQEPFPRDLARSASLALPVAIHEISYLSLAVVRQWLRDRGVADVIRGPDRRLRGCLLAYGGHGFVLIDSSDADDERRFTLAHEIAHFLLDYREPRREAIDALGDEIIAVLDGERPPTQTERLHAILSSVPVGLHLNLMERTIAGGYVSRATGAAEERADRLAFELLAPAAHVWTAISPFMKSGTAYPDLVRRFVDVLQEQYGLPHTQAQEYARWLLKHGGHKPGVREWLGIAER